MLSIQHPSLYGVLAGPLTRTFQKCMFSSLGNTSNAWRTICTDGEDERGGFSDAFLLWLGLVLGLFVVLLWFAGSDVVF